MYTLQKMWMEISFLGCTFLSLPFLAATKQLWEHICPSVCLSVCLSVTPLSLCSSHRIIIKFSGVIAIDKSDVHAKGQGQRSKVKVKEVKTNFAPIWAFQDCNSSLNSKMTTKCHGKLNKVSTRYLIKYGQCYWYVTIIFQIDLGFQKRCRTGSGISRLQ